MMRADPSDYELVAPKSLSAVVSLMAKSPGEWTPIAGGTDLMVLYAAGKLSSRKLVSLWNLPELRRIELTADEVRIGAACTYTDLRRHGTVQREFPLLTTAARWTGGIANQNRGTLGGNIVNASPAADSLPALLVYDAELILISGHGERRLAYKDFHTGYKQTLLAPDELIKDISLPRCYSRYISYSRKVGARNAQAIAKVCIAALARLDRGVVNDIRLAAGSVAPVPVRLRMTEQIIAGKRIDPVLMEQARQTATHEIRPIDDIRSTSRYRSEVLGNLVVEFLEQLAEAGRRGSALLRWNGLPADEAANEVLDCCGSIAWARGMAARRAYADFASLIDTSDEIWNGLEPGDWKEAFSKHPRIGERKPHTTASPQSLAWSSQEQRDAANVAEEIQSALAQANREYEARFGRTFIVCATGKSADEMLEILRSRMHNDESTELRVAAEEQRKITNIRLRKWLDQ
jgi:OHCU decarboxylase